MKNQTQRGIDLVSAKAHGMLKNVARSELVGWYVNACVANDSTNAEKFIAITWCPWTSAGVYIANGQGDGLGRKPGAVELAMSNSPWSDDFGDSGVSRIAAHPPSIVNT